MTAGATLEEIATMRRLAEEAGRLVLEIREAGFVVEEKGKNDPVTRADREANALICGALAAEFPGHGVLGEESVPTDPEALRALLGRERVFFVDPIDGTREFTQGRPDFCVMVGLAVEGRAAAGVVAIPLEGKVLWGSVGEGAWIDDGSPRRIALRDLTDPRRARAVASRSHASPATSRVLDALGVAEILPCGSVGVKAARVIEGAAEIYVHVSRGAKLWDVCAPEAILRAAGGEFTALSGSPIDYRGEIALERGLIAAVPGLFPRVLEAVRATVA